MRSVVGLILTPKEKVLLLSILHFNRSLLLPFRILLYSCCNLCPLLPRSLFLAIGDVLLRDQRDTSRTFSCPHPSVSRQDGGRRYGARCT